MPPFFSFAGAWILLAFALRRAMRRRVSGFFTMGDGPFGARSPYPGLGPFRVERNKPRSALTHTCYTLR